MLALLPGIDKLRKDEVTSLPLSVEAIGLVGNDSLVLFASSAFHGHIELMIPDKQKDLYLFGLPESQSVNVMPGSILLKEKAMVPVSCA